MNDRTSPPKILFKLGKFAIITGWHNNNGSGLMNSKFGTNCQTDTYYSQIIFGRNLGPFYWLTSFSARVLKEQNDPTHPQSTYGIEDKNEKNDQRPFSHDDEYIKLCKTILEKGSVRGDRTGTGTIGIFGYQMRFDLQKGFPLLTTKKVYMKGIVAELIWFLSGSTNNNDLLALGTKIWNEWAKEDGSLGPVYGHQLRNFGGDWKNNLKNGVDQISWVVDEIKKNPNSRRLIVSSWNPHDMPYQALPACHTMFQFYVQDGKLSCQLYQRSGDTLLGIPFNIASYALLTHMVAQACGLEVGEFVHTIGDAHIYLNHVDQIKEQISREPRRSPVLVLDPLIKNIDDFKPEHIKIENYDPHPPIKGAVSV